MTGGTLNVTITCPGHSSATIYYQVNPTGSQPNSTSSHGTGSVSIAVSPGDVLAAYATEPGWSDSLLARASYGVATPPGVVFRLINLNVGQTATGLGSATVTGAAGVSYAPSGDVWNKFGLEQMAGIQAFDALGHPVGTGDGVTVAAAFVYGDGQSTGVNRWFYHPISNRWMPDAALAAMKTALGSDSYRLSVVPGQPAPLMPDLPDRIEFTVTNLPVGVYDILMYLRGPADSVGWPTGDVCYGSGSATLCGAAGLTTEFGPTAPSAGPWKGAAYTEGVQYVRFNAVPVGPILLGREVGTLQLRAIGQTARLDMPEGVTAYDHHLSCNAIQIVQRKQVQQPVFAPWPMGTGVEQWGQGVTLECVGDWADADIWFTWTNNGLEPAAPSAGVGTKYTTMLWNSQAGLPDVVTNGPPIKFKAVAVKTGFQDSPVSSATFVQPTS